MNFLQILGYILYGILIFITFVWMLGVRKKLGILCPTIMGSLYFLILTIIFTLGDINYLHLAWVIPLVYVFILFNDFFFVVRIPIINEVFRFICQLYSGIIRIGINQERIRKAQELSYKRSIDDWAKKNQNK